MRLTVLGLLVAVAACSRPANSPTALDDSPTELSDAERAEDAATAKKVAAVLDAYTNDNAVLLGDGRYVWSSNRDGMSALFLADKDGTARKLPGPKEPIAEFRVTSDEKAVLLLADTGGDRRYRIYRVSLDGGAFDPVTPADSLSRRALVTASSRPTVFGYIASDHEALGTRVIVQEGAKAREVFREPHDGTLVDLSPAGDRALYLRHNDQNDTVLFDVDTASGTRTRIYPREGAKAKVTEARYSEGGILVATEEDGAPSSLRLMGPDGGEMRAQYKETAAPHGMILWIEVSPQRVAITVGAGNHTEVRLLDPKTLALVRSIDVGLSRTIAGPFARDGKRLSLSVSRADSPSDIYAVDVAAGNPVPLRNEPRPTLAGLPPMVSGVETIRAHDGLALPVNVYRPQEGTKLPTIVQIHGGPSASAYVRWNPETRFLVSMGFVVVEPNIRGSTGFGLDYERADDKEKRGDALRDVETVRNWAATRPWCDGQRIAIMGHSYGGYMTLLALARKPRLFRAGVDSAGMSDLRTMERLEEQRIRAYDETEFGVLGREDALLAEWSPLSKVDAIEAPLFVLQGKNDPVTPKNEADQIVRALRKRSVPVEYMVLANEGHGVARRENRLEVLARVARFLRMHLR